MIYKIHGCSEGEISIPEPHRDPERRWKSHLGSGIEGVIISKIRQVNPEPTAAIPAQIPPYYFPDVIPAFFISQAAVYGSPFQAQVPPRFESTNAESVCILEFSSDATDVYSECTHYQQELSARGWMLNWNLLCATLTSPVTFDMSCYWDLNEAGSQGIQHLRCKLEPEDHWVLVSCMTSAAYETRRPFVVSFEFKKLGVGGGGGLGGLGGEEFEDDTRDDEMEEEETEEATPGSSESGAPPVTNEPEAPPAAH